MRGSEKKYLKFILWFILIIVVGTLNTTVSAQLPQDHAYEETLRNYLATLKKDDFKVPLSRLKVDPSYFISADDAYKAWLFFGFEQSLMMNTDGLRVNASNFTLNSIEAGGNVNMTVGAGQFISAIATTFWADWNYKGNPHYNSRAVKLRAFVAAAVDMMMQDQDHEHGHNGRSDFLGFQLIRWAYAYGVAKDELPQNVRDAYEKGLIKMFEKLERWGPTGTHADMDMAAAVGVLYVAKYVNSTDLTQRAHQYIDRLLDQHLVDAGYIDHGSAYDAGYNGISLYFINWAAQLSHYQPLIQALKKMSKMKAYVTLPDPDGNRFSPFQSNPSSGSDAPHDLWSPYYRDVGVSKYSDDAIYLALRGGDKEIFSKSEMIEQMNNMLSWFHKSGSPNEFTTPSNDTPGKWKHEHWIDGSSMNPTALYYDDGLYDKLKSAKQTNSSLTKPPFAREGNFTKNFADKYLSVKRSTYGTIISTDRLSWWTNKGQTKTINGFGGGNLAAFWTPETGSVLLGGTRTDHKGGLDLEDWRIWPVQALSGETAAGSAFSSGIQRSPKATYNLNKETKTVTVSGDLSSTYSDPLNGLEGQVAYQRLFKVKENGVQVTTTVDGGGNNTISELYEILPVYRRNAYRQSSATPTQIEFKIDGSWQKASTDLKTVTSIRLRRFNGLVYIDFKNPQKIKLSPHDFYQNPRKNSLMQARNIMIKMSGAASLENASVSYFLRAGDAPANSNWDTDDNSLNTGGGGGGAADTTPPTVEISHSPDQPDSTQQITLETSASDAGGIKQIKLYFNGENIKTCDATESCATKVGPVTDGTYSYQVKATDQSGNTASPEARQLTVKTADTVSPSVQISSSPEHPDSTQAITLSANAEDASGIAELALYWQSQKIKTCTDAADCKVNIGSITDGTYSYYAKATDNDGNTTKSEEEKISVATTDTIKPDVATSLNPTNPDNSNPVTITVKANDANGIKEIKIFVDDKEAKTCSETKECKVKMDPFVDGGTHSYYAKGVDNSSNENTRTSEEENFNVTLKQPDNHTPVTVKATLQKNAQYVEAKVEKVTDEDGDPIQLTYDWQINKKSLALVNMPFDVSISKESAIVNNYSNTGNNGKTAKISKMPAWTKDGERGGALTFDGKDDYIEIPSKENAEKLKKFTVEAWIKHDDWGNNWASIISKPLSSDSWKNPWSVFNLSRYKDQDNVYFQITVAGDKAERIHSKNNIQANKWTYIVGTYDGKTLKLYINGKLDTSKKVNKELFDKPDSDILVGKNFYKGDLQRFYKGSIDEVKVLNTALTAGEVSEHYQLNYNKVAISHAKTGQKWQVSISANDTKAASDPIETNSITVTANDETEDIDSTSTTLSQNYPNPFSAHTTIAYHLKSDTKVTIKLFDSTGRFIKTVFEGKELAGNRSHDFSPANLASGIYFYQLILPDEIITKKMTYIK